MPVESYEDDDEEQEGPRSSFGTYLAEGDALFKQSEYKKALESYSLALELQPNDKTCLVARSKCYLKLGDPQKALQDAEDALAEDKEFNKGLYRKAEALYCMGDFEYALMYYHRGHKLRPELDEFRLGIQKAQEAIDNSIGSAAKIKLENKGDLSFFTKQDDMVNKKRAGYLKPMTHPKKLKPLANRNKEVKPPAPSKKTVKQLLGELYSDKEYFEKLMEDEAFIKSPQNSQIYELVQSGLTYLETRTEFWRQQKPLYARKKEKAKYNIVHKKTKPSISKYVLKQLQEVDQALSSGNSDRSLRLAQKLLKSVEGINKDDLPNKVEVIANIHSCIGNAYIELEQLGKALRHHEKDLQLSKQSKLVDGVSRALDNVGRVHARMGNFKKAVSSWNEKLPLVKASLESTWLCHEIGRCHLEMGNNAKALEFGQKSLAAGKDCEDQIWQLNAYVLIAQSQVKLGSLDNAIDTFSHGLEIAVALGDTSAQAAISKALSDLQRRSSRASGRNTSHSEDEGSPRIKSDVDDRVEADLIPFDSEGSSHKSSPKPDENKNEELHEDTNEVDPPTEANTTDVEDAREESGKEIVEYRSGLERDPRGSEGDRIPLADDHIPSLPSMDEHNPPLRAVGSYRSDDDDVSRIGTELDVSVPVDTGYDEAEKEEIARASTEAPVNESGAKDNLEVEASESYVESGQPLTTEDLNRDASAEKLESVIMNESTENMDSPIASNENIAPQAESMGYMSPPTVSNEYFVSPLGSTEDTVGEQTTAAQKDDAVTDAVVESVVNSESVPENKAEETEEPVTNDAENLTTSENVSSENTSTPSETTDDLTAKKSTENTVSSISTDNVISTTKSDITTTENVTSLTVSTENMDSLAEATENADSITVSESVDNVTSENVSNNTSSEVLVDQVSLAQDTLHLANSIGSKGGEESENVTQDVTTTQGAVEVSGVSNSGQETGQDLSQSSNIEELPTDSNRTTPDISESTEKDVTVSGENAEATTTEDIPHDANETTLNSTADEITADTSEATVADSNSEDKTPRDVSQDSQDVDSSIQESAEESSQATNENVTENVSTNENSSRDEADNTTDTSLPGKT